MVRYCRIFSMCLLMSFWLGCDEPPEIQQYRVAKSRSDLGDIGTKEPFQAPNSELPSMPSSAATETVPSRMVVAIASRDDATWYFKLTGAIAAVNETEAEWQQILASVDFNAAGQPTWDAPDDWQVGPKKQFRFATLLRSSQDDGNVELAISNLAPNQNMLANVNRWQGQLQQPDLTKDQLELKTIDYQSGEFQVYEGTGPLGGSPSMATRKPPTQPRPAAPAEPELNFDVPDGWDEGPVNSIVKVRLLHGTEKNAPQISVTQLMASANTWIPNAQRWARQVEMDQSAEVLTENTVEVSVAELDGQRIRLIPDGDAEQLGLVGIMVVRDELAWFFKLFGDAKEVAKLEADFDQFVKSFKFN